MIRRLGSCPRHPTDPELPEIETPAAWQFTASQESERHTIAIPDWEGRVSPVFDVAARLLITDIAAGIPTSSRYEQLPPQAPADRACQLAEWHIDTLICGGISNGLRAALEHAGVAVFPHVCGSVPAVLQAYLDRRLAEDQFAMPGCCRRRPERPGQQPRHPKAEL